MLALRYVIVMMRAATGSQLVRQLLRTDHYAAPPKTVTRRTIVDILVSFYHYVILSTNRFEAEQWGVQFYVATVEYLRKLFIL